MSIERMIAESENELIGLRRDFHKHPELGLEEHRTAEKIETYLGECGLSVRRMAKTGVVGVLEGTRSGPTLLIRADIDALPIQEENDLPFKSINDGVMHACGHDGHTAINLVTAKILSRIKDDLSGKIKFVFQPNEENVGALSMIQGGVLEYPKVDASLGCHLWAPLEVGRIGLKSGPIMAGMAHFDLIVSGKGGHTATPQSAVDPVLAAAAVVQGVQSLQTREIDVLKEPVVLMFGQIHGGSTSNVIPDRVTLSGTIRYLFEGAEKSEENPRNRFERIAKGICAAHRAGCELEFIYGHPTLVNHPEMTDLVHRVAMEDMTHPPAVTPLMTLAGEDFSEFACRTPASFYFIGAGNHRKGIVFPHHHPHFDIDEEALSIGVEINVKTALRFLKHSGLPSACAPGGSSDTSRDIVKDNF